MSRPVHVIGYVGDAAPVTQETQDAVRAADLVVGGRRHLDAFGVEEDRRIVLGPLGPAIEALTARADRSAVVVASGDPGFFGIVRRLQAAGLTLHVDPAPSACALAFGRVGQPWEDAQIVSAHGRDLRRALNVARAYERVGVMTTVGAGIREIAAGLGDRPRRFVLVERLGEPGERVRWFSPDDALDLDPADIAEPNVVLVLPSDDAPSDRWTGPGMPWRLGDRGEPRAAAMLQRDPLAALVVGALAPRPGELLGLVGHGLDGVEQAAVVHGAAVSTAPTFAALAARGDVVSTRYGDVPTLEEPDLLCLRLAGGARHPGASDLDLTPWTARLRALVVVADDPAAPVASALMTGLPDGWDRHRLAVPLTTAIDGRSAETDPLTLFVAVPRERR